jgi:hypothetical protein
MGAGLGLELSSSIRQVQKITSARIAAKYLRDYQAVLEKPVRPNARE